MESKDYLQDLSDIRDMMRRSTQFMSLSGLSGVLAGCYALAGAYAAHEAIQRMGDGYTEPLGSLTFVLAGIAAVVALASLVTAVTLSYRRAARKGETIWSPVSRRLIVNFMIPLATGGAFLVQLVLNGDFALVAPSVMIFYGLSCVNASKYTLRDVRWLGVTIVAIGLLSVSFPTRAIPFLAVGLGVTHILYGLLMYLRYERR